MPKLNDWILKSGFLDVLERVIAGNVNQTRRAADASAGHSRQSHVGRRGRWGGLNHRDDPAGRVKAASDSRLTHLDSGLPGIVYAHHERSRKRAAAMDEQATGACRAHAHGTKGRSGRRNCLTADAKHATTFV